ncbi:MAG: hypothetical protein APF76_11270 [Desulfitibacter sp. BRH_c19]|nr:MAG: hypothetical protein APF76_11270 [Desulfitibacter sp. BRH_c19]
MDKLLKNKKLLVSLFVALLLVLLFINMTATPESDNKVVSINSQQARDLIESEPNLIILDVREPHEFQGGHIPGAILIPLGILQEHLDTLNPDSPILLVCRSGNRSMQAARILVDEGFTNLYNLSGGMLEWSYDVEID